MPESQLSSAILKLISIILYVALRRLSGPSSRFRSVVLDLACLMCQSAGEDDHFHAVVGTFLKENLPRMQHLAGLQEQMNKSFKEVDQ